MSDTLAPVIEDLARQRWPGAHLTTLTHLAGDFSARRYLRARLTGGDAPPTVVVMVLAGSGLPLSSEELAIFPEPPRELPFVDVHRLLTAIGAPVPAIHVAAVDQGLLLLEDVGDVLLWDAVSAHPADAEALYRRAIDAVLILHTRGSTHPDRSCIAFAQRFDAQLYRWELEHFLEYGVERRLGRPLEAGHRAAFAASFDAISEELGRAELVLSHRDFHSWNILVRNGATVMIDFQDALLAPPEYDLASLLTDRVTPRLIDPAMERRLVDYYWAARGADATGSRRRYGLLALQRALKVIGRIHYVATEKKKPAALAFVPDVVATARRWLSEVAVPGELGREFEALPWPAALAATDPA